MIETENGMWPETRIHTEGASASHAHVDNSVNKALPWFGISIVFGAISLAISIYSLATAFHARDSAWMTETRYLQQTDYIEKMRFELASHGIRPPDLPPELRGK